MRRKLSHSLNAARGIPELLLLLYRIYHRHSSTYILFSNRGTHCIAIHKSSRMQANTAVPMSSPNGSIMLIRTTIRRECLPLRPPCHRKRRRVSNIHLLRPLMTTTTIPTRRITRTIHMTLHLHMASIPSIHRFLLRKASNIKSLSSMMNIHRR